MDITERLDVTPLRLLFETNALLKDLAKHASAVEICAQGAAHRASIVESATFVEIARESALARERIARIEDNREWIVLRDALEFSGDYRSIIASCFSKLAIGGWLTIIVPHQFLFERKLQLPSRFDSRVIRLYTPATLLSEVEEALDPNEYRLRSAFDCDEGFDYDVPLSGRSVGGSFVVLAIQRIARPAWADEITTEIRTSNATSTPAHIGEPGDPSVAPYHVIAPAQINICKILAIKLDHRGDFILATPAFSLLRKYFPQASIALVCGSWNVGAATECGLFDEIIPFDFWREDPSAGASLPPERQRVQAFKTMLGDRRFDLAIDLRLYEDSRQVCKAVNARRRAGFDRRSEFSFLDIALSAPSPTREGRAEQASLAGRTLHPLGLLRHLQVIGHRFFGSGPWRRRLVAGPYRELAPGSYELEVMIEPAGHSSGLIFELGAGDGGPPIATGVLSTGVGPYPTARFDLAEPIKNFELRLVAPKGGKLPRFWFRGLRYHRSGRIIGQHQSEAMSLLVHLTAMRLQSGFELETLNAAAF